MLIDAINVYTNDTHDTYSMNNATLKTDDVERDLGVIINSSSKYSKQY